MSDLERFELQKREISWTKCILFSLFDNSPDWIMASLVLQLVLRTTTDTW